MGFGPGLSYRRVYGFRQCVTSTPPFCQNFLVWQDVNGKVHLSYNDKLAIAKRQGVGKSIPLRVINYRLSSVFEDALKP